MIDLELNKATAAAALTPPARRVHRHVLAAFATTGASEVIVLAVRW